MSKFNYFNANPRGEKTSDCVIRAISLALNINYYEVIDLLRENGEFYKCDELCVICYEKLLDDYFKLPHFDANEKLVQEIIDDHPNDVLLIRMEGHLTCSMFGKSYDIFDCTDYKATDYWVC